MSVDPLLMVESELFTPVRPGQSAKPERLPPQSLEAEEAILGGLLIDPDAMSKVVEILAPKHFYKKAHQEIYKVMLSLFDSREPIDVITVPESLKDKGILEEIGDWTYINDLALSVLTTENIQYYAQVVADKSIRRDLIRAGSEIASLSYEEEKAEVALDHAQKVLFKVVQQGMHSDLAHIRDVLPTTFEQIEERHANKGSLMGAATGFYDLDNYLSGLQKSDLIILAARPSMGKTAFALNIVSHVALREQKPVLVFSLEMSKEQLATRLLCSEAEIDAQRIRTGEIPESDFAKIANVMGRLGDAPIYIDDSPGVSVMEVRAKARKLMMERGESIGLVVIDYLQLMEEKKISGGSDNRVQEIAAISRGLKTLAREIGAPVIALSQLSRAVESRQDKRPMLSDLRESGSIEQDADVVMFIYRDEYYNPETDRPGMADIIIAKQRNGPVGTISLIFRHNITRFMNPVQKKVQVF